MTNLEVIEFFFSQQGEKEFNDAMLDDKNYVIPQDALDNYIKTILSVPYGEYIQYQKSHKSSLDITSKNISQFSNYSACELEMCQALLNDGNIGLSFIEIGKLFPQYVKKNTDEAYRKFGENQIKTSAQLGLTFEYFDKWFLGCLGYVFPFLSDDVKQSVLARTLLRDSLYANIAILLTEGDVDLISFMSTVISPGTSSRRYSNVLTLANICVDACKKEGVNIGCLLETRDNINSSDTVKESDFSAGKTILLSRPTDSSLFKFGFTIPTAKHELWKRYFDIEKSVFVGSKRINLIVDKKQFKASLSCSTNHLNKQVMQIRYKETDPIAKYLRTTFHVSFDYIRSIQEMNGHNNRLSIDIPIDIAESLDIFAANRNDTIYISTLSVDKRIAQSAIPAVHQGVRDLDFYKGCFRDISISSVSRKVIIGKLCMLLSFVDYLKWLDNNYENMSNPLPVLGCWENMYLWIFSQHFIARRTSTLFSSPFILLNDEPFWKVVVEEGVEPPTDGEHAMMTFVNIQSTYSGVIIDDELLSFIRDKQSCLELCEYIRKLLKSV